MRQCPGANEWSRGLPIKCNQLTDFKIVLGSAIQNLRIKQIFRDVISNFAFCTYRSVDFTLTNNDYILIICTCTSSAMETTLLLPFILCMWMIIQLCNPNFHWPSFLFLLLPLIQCTGSSIMYIPFSNSFAQCVLPGRNMGAFSFLKINQRGKIHSFAVTISIRSRMVKQND